MRSSIGKIATVEPNSGDMLLIVVRSATGSAESPRPKNSTNFPTTPLLAQHLGDGQHEIGRRHALAQLAVQPKPTTSGMSIVTGWPSIAASASMPPTPHASTPSPLTIVVCESVPTAVSG